MTTIQFTRLSDAPVREAWPDEARDFTPWLFDNISFLSDALGIELKAASTGREICTDAHRATRVP